MTHLKKDRFEKPQDNRLRVGWIGWNFQRGILRRTTAAGLGGRGHVSLRPVASQVGCVGCLTVSWLLREAT